MKLILAVAMVIAVCGTPEINPAFHGLTLEEWEQAYLMPIDPLEDITPPKYLGLDGAYDSVWNVPEINAFDWRADAKYGQCIEAIQDQGSCGSCWAFATSEVASDKWCFATETAEHHIFSPQHLMDCDTKESGCSGAITDRVIGWIVENEVVDASCYPYKAKKEVCHVSDCPAYHMKNDRVLRLAGFLSFCQRRANTH